MLSNSPVWERQLCAGPRNMCRIMYFQCGIGAHQQRLKLSDGRLFQVGGADTEKSLVSWLLMISYDFIIILILDRVLFLFSLPHWRM